MGRDERNAGTHMRSLARCSIAEASQSVVLLCRMILSSTRTSATRIFPCHPLCIDQSKEGARGWGGGQSTSRYISRSHALADAYRLSVCSTAPAHSITSAIQTHASESRGPGPRPSRAPLHHFSPFNRLLPFRRRREAEDADAALKLWWFWVDTNA